MGLEHTTGGRDLLVFVAVPDLHALYRYLHFRLQRIPGVTGTRSSMVTAVHTAPDRWRLDQLTPAQTDLLTGRTRRAAATVVPAVGAVAAMPVEDRPLVLALASDARRSVASLARESGMSESTVRRLLGRLEAGQSLRYSCAMASGLSGWPVSATLWAEVPEYEVMRLRGGGLGAARDADLHVRQRPLELHDQCPAALGRGAVPLHGRPVATAAGAAHHRHGGGAARAQVGGAGAGPAGAAGCGPSARTSGRTRPRTPDACDPGRVRGPGPAWAPPRRARGPRGSP